MKRIAAKYVYLLDGYEPLKNAFVEFSDDGTVVTIGEADSSDEMLDGAGNADVEAARDALIRDGYEASVYGRPVADAAADLFEVAHNALATNERNYLSPLHQLVRTRKTLADLASS